ncbi:protein MOR1, partial [Tanacetum coccineum]
VRAAVKSEETHVRSRTLNWVMYCITSSNKAVILNVHKRYIWTCLECLNDGTADIRDAAFSVLVAIGKSVGMGILNMSLEKLDYVRRKKLPEMIGVSGGGAMKQGVSRRRIAEPSEMTLKENESRLEYLFREHSITQPKNAAWKELLEETNQLQKMSLSDSQEQNKKQKQHACSESVSEEQNKKRKQNTGSEKVEEEDLETWIKEVKLINSLACKRCGIIICVCQQELEFDMDEMPSLSIFSYGAAETLKRGPDPDSWCPSWE